jgi:hypothetical protein
MALQAISVVGFHVWDCVVAQVWMEWAESKVDIGGAPQETERTYDRANSARGKSQASGLTFPLADLEVCPTYFLLVSSTFTSTDSLPRITFTITSSPGFFARKA